MLLPTGSPPSWQVIVRPARAQRESRFTGSAPLGSTCVSVTSPESLGPSLWTVSEYEAVAPLATIVCGPTAATPTSATAAVGICAAMRSLDASGSPADDRA